MVAIICCRYGGVAQLGERTVRIRKVESSILFVSTRKNTPYRVFFLLSTGNICVHVV